MRFATFCAEPNEPKSAKSWRASAAVRHVRFGVSAVRNDRSPSSAVATNSSFVSEILWSSRNETKRYRRPSTTTPSSKIFCRRVAHASARAAASPPPPSLVNSAAAGSFTTSTLWSPQTRRITPPPCSSTA